MGQKFCPGQFFIGLTHLHIVLKMKYCKNKCLKKSEWKWITIKIPWSTYSDGIWYHMNHQYRKLYSQTQNNIWMLMNNRLPLEDKSWVFTPMYEKIWNFCYYSQAYDKCWLCRNILSFFLFFRTLADLNSTSRRIWVLPGRY